MQNRVLSLCLSLRRLTWEVCDLRHTAERSYGVRAVEQIRKMPGGSQSHLMRCSDGQFYVVKFQNNPQHRRVLVNEFLGTWLARELGLPVTSFRVITVDKELIRLTPDLSIELPHKRKPCEPGLQFGSRFVGDPTPTNLFWLPLSGSSMSAEMLNQFAGMLVFDKWTCNTDGRQVLFYREQADEKTKAVMIDQGFCFNAGDWNFSDSAIRGKYFDTTVYQNIRGIDDFEPWLSRIEFDTFFSGFTRFLPIIPSEWYESDRDSLLSLLDRLDRRRKTIRERLHNMNRVVPELFPKWRKMSLKVSSIHKT